MALELGHAPLNVDSDLEDNEQLMLSPRLVPRNTVRVKVFGAGAMMAALATGLIVLSIQSAQKQDDDIQNVQKGVQGLQMKDEVATDPATSKDPISCDVAKQKYKDAKGFVYWAKDNKDSKAKKDAKKARKAAKADLNNCIDAASSSRWVDLDLVDTPTQAQIICAEADKKVQDLKLALRWAKQNKDTGAKKDLKDELKDAKAARKDTWGDECRTVAEASCGDCIGCMKPNGRCKDWKEETCEVKQAMWCKSSSSSTKLSSSSWSASDAAAKLLAEKLKVPEAIMAAVQDTATSGKLEGLAITHLTCVASGSSARGDIVLIMDSSTAALADKDFPRWIADGIAHTMGCLESQVDVWIQSPPTDGAGRRLTSTVSATFNVYNVNQAHNIGLGIGLGLVAPTAGVGLGL